MKEDIEKRIDMMRKLQESLRESEQIVDIQYLGKIELDGKNQDIYLVIEQQMIVKDGKKSIVEIETYVTEEMEEIAGNNKNDRYEFLLVTEKYIEQKEDIEEQLNELLPKSRISLKEVEKERINEIAEALGIEVEQIEEIEELDLKQQINIGEKEDKEKEELTENEIDSIQIKEETSLGQNIKGTTLENKLGLKKYGIEDGVKLARVSSSSLNKYISKANTQVDAFVVIRSNGKAVVLGENILAPDNKLGTNPSTTGTTINNDGTVRQEGITSSYRICNSNGNEYLRISHDESSGKEIKYGMYSPQEGEYVDVELETQRTAIQNNDVRQFMKDKGAGEREAQDVLKRNEQHGECEDKDVTVIDNDKTNDSHTHQPKGEDYIPNTNTTWEKLAEICGYRGEDRIKQAYEKWEEKKYDERNTTKDNKQLIEEIEEEINEEYGMPERGI